MKRVYKQILFYVVCIIIGAALCLGASMLFYGDPMCAFKQCVVVKGGK